MTSPALPLPEPPECDTGHRGANRAADQYACPKCTARKIWAAMVRKQEISEGLRPSRRSNPLDFPADQCRQHPHYDPTCESCRAYSRYSKALRVRGLNEPRIPVQQVRAYLHTLIDKKTGGWLTREISARTGLGENTIQRIISPTGRTKSVTTVTWDAIRALKPRNQPAAYHGNRVPAIEVQRIVQGLNAQGWTFQPMADMLGHRDPDTSRDLAVRKRDWVSVATRDKVRAMRDRLAPYDVTVMASPLPGMSREAAEFARKRNWVPLAAWRRQDLADPAAQPYPQRPRVVQDAASADLLCPCRTGTSRHCRCRRRRRHTPDLPFVDTVLKSLVRRNIQKINESATGNCHRPSDVYIEPLGRITRLELLAVVDYADAQGVTDAGIAIILGYPCRTEKEVETGQRTVQRYVSIVKNIRQWIAAEPTGEPPAWFTSGRSSYDDLIPPLIALQSDPFGPGWDVAELAGRCGLEQEQLWPFLLRAIEYGNRLWQPQSRHTTTAA